MKEYTIKQAAEILEVSTSTIRRRIKSGEIAAEKKESPYGKQYFIPAAELDQATTETEIMKIKEVKQPVNAETVINRIVRATEQQNKELIDEAVNNIADKIEGQNKQLEQQNEKLDQQQELIKKLSDQVETMQQNQNKSFIDKIKNFFK